jgi:hypothetical protein
MSFERQRATLVRSDGLSAVPAEAGLADQGDHLDCPGREGVVGPAEGDTREAGGHDEHRGDRNAEGPAPRPARAGGPRGDQRGSSDLLGTERSGWPTLPQRSTLARDPHHWGSEVLSDLPMGTTIHDRTRPHRYDPRCVVVVGAGGWCPDGALAPAWRARRHWDRHGPGNRPGLRVTNPGSPEQPRPHRSTRLAAPGAGHGGAEQAAAEAAARRAGLAGGPGDRSRSVARLAHGARSWSSSGRTTSSPRGSRSCARMVFPGRSSSPRRARSLRGLR